MAGGESEPDASVTPDDPAAINKPRHRSQKSADPTYHPLSDPNFRVGQTTTSDSEAGSPKRRRSKGKGRSSIGGRPLALDAIPRGIRDNQVWSGKKRKAKRGTRKSTTGAAGHEGEEQEEEEEEEDQGEEAEKDPEAQDMGGMDPNEHDEDEDVEEGDETPPAATYFLRLKSPSPPAGRPDGSARSRHVAPSAAQTSNIGASTSRQPIDPAFAAFDRSLGGGAGQDSNSLSASFDDSALRGSSYDYSEEERIMQALEAQKRQRIEQRQQQQQQQVPTPQQQPRQARVSYQPTPKTGPNPATPVISNGGYPATPNAGPVSPVTAFRKRRLPGPPSMLGAGTPLGAPADDDADRMARAESMGGEWGRKCGNALRPIVRFAGRLWQQTQDPLLNWPRILKALAAILLVSSLLAASM